MAKRLWEKGEGVNALVHRFTVGNDPQTDLHLVRWDAIGSAAHAKMLAKIGILSTEELAALLPLLKEVIGKAERGEFTIPPELEDCHTAIEAFLTEKAGAAGERIHTGRSRNDQVLLATRLYLRNAVARISDALIDAAESLLERIQREGTQPMPGYTHFQPAMPASIGMWAGAFVESFLDLVREGRNLAQSLNRNPLGAASGFGINLNLDREMTTELLGFDSVQRNPIDIQNSRGRYELRALRWMSDISTSLEKISWDLILYTSREFGFFKLPDAFTTGSSIMPQKHNPDVLELVRATAAKVRAAEVELMLVTSKMPSNYHRDFQYTKEPLIRGVEDVLAMLAVMTEVFGAFTLVPERLDAAMTPDLFATYAVYRDVKKGIPFREAYRSTAAGIKDGSLDVSDLKGEFSSIQNSLERESAAAQKELSGLKSELKTSAEKLAAVENRVLG